jgi:hypothetical protein
MADNTSNLTIFAAAGPWAADDDNGIARSGNLVIALAADDPTTWRVTGENGKAVFTGRVPREDSSLLGLLDYELSPFGLTTEGLSAWAERAEAVAAGAFAAEEVKADLANLDPFPGTLAADLLAQAPTEPAWLVPGVSAPGWLTKFGGREKLGKGTLATNLIGKLERNEDSVFGSAPDAPVQAVIFTEEPKDSLNEKLRLAGIERARVIYSWELGSLGWRGKVDMLMWIAWSERRGLIFIDNVSRAAGIEDEAGTEFGRALEYLGDKCRAYNIAGWVDHHHKKGSGRREDASRGSTSIGGAVDMSLEIFRSKSGKRVRDLMAQGRIRATNWERSVELSEDGTEYTDAVQTTDSRPDPEAEAMADVWRIPVEGITVKQYEDMRKVSHSEARRRLETLVDEGMAVKRKPEGEKAFWYFRPPPASPPEE